jgi:hypothetical protein
MKILLDKTRWYFRTYGEKYAIESCVEFSRLGDGKLQVNVFDREGRQLLWSSTGAKRADQTTARRAFEVFAKLEATKQRKPARKKNEINHLAKLTKELCWFDRTTKAVREND